MASYIAEHIPLISMAPASFAAQNDDSIILQSYCDGSAYTEEDEEDDEWKEQRKELFQSIELGLYVNVARYLESGAPPNITSGEFGINACHAAAFLGRTRILILLIENGTEFDVVDKKCRTPLDMAIWNGNEDCLLFLLYKLNKIPAKEMSAYSNSDIVADIAEIKNVWSETTPLHIASGRVHSDCLQILFKNGFDCNTNDVNGLSPLDVCGAGWNVNDIAFLNNTIKQRFEDSVKLLIEHECSVHEMKVSSPLHRAIHLNSKSALISLSQFKEYHRSLEDGEAPLHLIIKKKNRGLLYALLKELNKPDEKLVDVKNNKGLTPLHIAILTKWNKCVSALLQKGADVLAVSKYGNTSLHFAALSRAPNIITIIMEALPDKDHDINIQNNDQETALHKAIKVGGDIEVEMLINENASIDLVTKFNYTTVHNAVLFNNKNILRRLLVADSAREDDEKIIDNYTTDQLEMTALHLAAFNNNFECFEILLEFKADLRKRTITYWCTPLHLAAQQGHLKIIEIILKVDITLLDERDSQKWKPFYSAVHKGHRDCVSYFLEKGADLADTLSYKDKRKTVMELLINNIPRSHEYLENLFDSYISKNEYGINDDRCEITVDYSILMPAHEAEVENMYNNQMDVVLALSYSKMRSKERKILLHPYIESYLYLKWVKGIKYVYGCLVFLFVLFTFSLTATVICIYSKECNLYVPKIILAVFLIYMLLQELFLMTVLIIKKKTKQYFKRNASYLNWICVSLSIAVLLVDHSNPENNWPKIVTAFAVLTAWLEITTLLSNFPECGYTFQMFSTVINRAMKVMVIFGLEMIIGFSLTFWLLFQGKSAFTGFMDTFVRTIVMTTEFDYVTLFDDFERNGYRLFVQVMFVIFIFFIPIVMMNLILALIISDTNDLKTVGKIKRLVGQVMLIDILECVIYFTMGKTLASLDRVIKIYPGKPSWEAIGLISNNLEEALFQRVNKNTKVI